MVYINRTNTNRTIAGIMAAMMLVVMLFSGIFIIEHADHECSGEDCPICESIQLCESMLPGLGIGIPEAGMQFIPLVAILVIISIPVCSVIADTPVSNKVRLNH